MKLCLFSLNRLLETLKQWFLMQKRFRLSEWILYCTIHCSTSRNNFVMVSNWSSVGILATLNNKNPSRLATITAASVKNSKYQSLFPILLVVSACECGPKIHTLSHDPIVFRTPSLQYFGCPDLTCVTEIHPLSEYEAENYIPRILVSTKSQGGNDIDLRFGAANRSFTWVKLVLWHIW